MRLDFRLPLRRRPRIFQIGFNRCGTRTLHYFFEGNGLVSVHWEQSEIALRFAARKARGEPPFRDYDGSWLRWRPRVDAFTDMIGFEGDRIIEVYKDFEYLHRFHPDGYFILNTRPVENWIRSRLGHQRGRFHLRYRALVGSEDPEHVADYWRREWAEHHAAVTAYFDRPGVNFLRFDIEADDPKALCSFLEPGFGRMDPAAYGHVVGKRKQPARSSPETHP